MKTLLFAGLLSVAASLHAQDTTYDWTGTGGFTAQITLDSPSSPVSGGSLSDIVSIFFIDPASDGGPYGPYSTYATTYDYPGYGVIPISASEFDSTTASLTGDFNWNSTEITSMALSWNVGATACYFDAGSEFGNSIAYLNYDAGVQASDNTGLYQTQSVPDAGSTSLLLGAALAGLGGFYRKRRA